MKPPRNHTEIKKAIDSIRSPKKEETIKQTKKKKKKNKKKKKKKKKKTKQKKNKQKKRIKRKKELPQTNKTTFMAPGVYFLSLWLFDFNKILNALNRLDFWD